MKKKTGILFVLLFCLWVLPFNVHGASKVRVKVNNNMYAMLENTDKKWKLELPEDAQYNPFEDKVLYLGMPKGSSLKSGYYVFDRKGVLNTGKKFYTLNAKVYKREFKGEYFFGEINGRLTLNKKGWVTVKGKEYFISDTGKKYVNRWVNGYYLLDTGLVAKNMKTPDGFYVDCNGRKCKKNEMKLSSLKKNIESTIDGYRGNWSVYVKNLKTGDILSINEKRMKPASVIKLFTMASTYSSIKKGEIKQDKNINSLLNSLITVSSNEAYNSLTRKHSKKGSFLDGCSKVNKNIKVLGCKNTESHSTLHPSSSSFASDGKSNFTTAKDVGILLEKIYRGECVSEKYSKEMLNLLLKQTRRWKIPAGLPAGVKCANKTGENSSCQNDVAIVYGKKTTYIVCIFAETGEYSGVTGIKKLSSKIYSYLNK